MVNQYKEFIGLINYQQRLAGAAQDAHTNPNVSILTRKIAADAVSRPEEKAYLRREATPEQIYGLLTQTANYVDEQIENSIKSNLEGILRDVPEELGLVEYAAKNIKPVKTRNEEHDIIAMYHEEYRNAKQVSQDYNSKAVAKRVDARGKLLSVVDKVYDERYADHMESAELMKKIARISDDILEREYKKIVNKAEKEFDRRLNSNIAHYLSENVKGMEDKLSFIRYIISGDKKHLVKTAQENEDTVSATSLSEEIQMDQLAQMSPQEQQRVAFRRDYANQSEDSEEGLALSRGSGMPAPSNIPVVAY